MGRHLGVWSPIQFQLANQQKVIPIGRLLGVQVDIDGVKSFADFEVISIIDGTNPYPTLLGIEWAIDNQAIINLKNRHMLFEGRGICIIAPLDPVEGARYTEPSTEEYDPLDLDNIYKLTARNQDYINPTADGNLSWRSISSCASDSEEGLDNWQNRLH